MVTAMMRIDLDNYLHDHMGPVRRLLVARVLDDVVETAVYELTRMEMRQWHRLRRSQKEEAHRLITAALRKRYGFTFPLWAIIVVRVIFLIIEWWLTRRLDFYRKDA